MIVAVVGISTYISHHTSSMGSDQSKKAYLFLEWKSFQLLIPQLLEMQITCVSDILSYLLVDYVKFK